MENAPNIILFWYLIIALFVLMIAGLFLGASLNNAIGGCILGVLISGIACIIYVLDNQDNN